MYAVMGRGGAPTLCGMTRSKNWLITSLDQLKYEIEVAAHISNF